MGSARSSLTRIDRGFGPIQIVADVVAQKPALDAAGEPVTVSVGQIRIWSNEAIPERRWRRSTAPPLRLQSRYERRDRAGPPVAAGSPAKTSGGLGSRSCDTFSFAPPPRRQSARNVVARPG